MADIDTVEKRINSDGRKAKSDKKFQVVLDTYNKVFAELNK